MDYSSQCCTQESKASVLYNICSEVRMCFLNAENSLSPVYCRLKSAQLNVSKHKHGSGNQVHAETLPEPDRRCSHTLRKHPSRVLASVLVAFVAYRIHVYTHLCQFGGPFGTEFTNLPHALAIFGPNLYLWYEQVNDTYCKFYRHFI